MTVKKESQETVFNPSDHLESIKGRPYLPVAWRLVWVRAEHPTWSIQTEVKADFDNSRCISKATISDENGKILATAHKVEDKQGFGDFVEKSETGAIGRALAMCGYGTQFSPDLEEGTERIVDSLVSSRGSTQTATEPLKAKRIDSVEDAKKFAEDMGTLGIEDDPSMCSVHKVTMPLTAKTGRVYHKDVNADGDTVYCFGNGYKVYNAMPKKEDK